MLERIISIILIMASVTMAFCRIFREEEELDI